MPDTQTAAAVRRNAPWTKENHPLGGRKKGSINRTTAAVKEALLEAFERGGGVNALLALMRSDDASDRRAFWTLIGRILPQEIRAELTVRTWEDMLHEVAQLRAGKSVPALPASTNAQLVAEANDLIIDVEPIGPMPEVQHE